MYEIANAIGTVKANRGRTVLNQGQNSEYIYIK